MSDATTTCPACETEAKMEAGAPVTEQERAAWMMWGCTCEPGSADEAAREMAAQHD